MPSDAYENFVALFSAGKVMPETPLEDARAGWDMLGATLPLADGVTVEPVRVGELSAEWLAPAGVGNVTVLHLHGGGYVIGSCASHRPFASHLAATLEARVLVPEYRRAPEHPAPAAIDDALACYRWLLESGIEPGQLVVSGDSAGGGLALALALEIQRDVTTPAAALVLLSPWTDLTLSGASLTARADEDVILAPETLAHWADLYAGTVGTEDPRVSPLFADLSALPPTLVLAGSREVLLDDAIRFAEKADTSAVDVTLEVWDDMIHIWPVLGAGVVPEARDALERITSFVRSLAGS
jgi:monoterpene epsilon-lactone hydrolase